MSFMHVPVWLPTVPIAPHRTVPGLENVNDIPLTRKLLTRALSDLSKRLYRSFRRQVHLVVHSGAVTVLHPLFSHRKSTQDVDNIHRSFVSEYRALGFSRYTTTTPTPYHGDRSKVGLGADWMNDHADVALSWTLDQQGRTYDLIFNASTRHQNAVSQTIFNGRGLTLFAFPWPWA